MSFDEKHEVAMEILSTSVTGRPHWGSSSVIVGIDIRTHNGIDSTHGGGNYSRIIASDPTRSASKQAHSSLRRNTWCGVPRVPCVRG